MASKAALFKPLTLNTGTTLLNRIGLSAMTRTRATIDTNIPTDLFPVYYGQRTTKGSLLVTECTQVSQMGRGYARSPGLYNEAQQQGWAKTAEAVHSKGGVLYVQLFHAGRVAHSSLLNGKPPVAPSPLAPAGTTFGLKGDQFPYETPLELTEKEIEQTIKDFARSSRLAIEAGLDGVELHAANGYLIQQFLASKTNKRNDKYGGSVEKRSRFLLELVDACQEATNGRVAVKVSPGITFTDIQESEEEVKELYGFLLSKLAEKRVNYVHFSDNMKFLKSLGAPNVPTFSFDLFKFARDQIKGSDTRLIANGGISIDEAAQLIQSEVVDAVSFASLFLTNPDLVTAIEKGVPLRPPMEDRNLWYGRFTDDSQDHIGYTEYPPLVL